MIQMLTGAKTSEVSTLLADLAREIDNIRGANPTPVDRLNAWRSWSVRTLQRARPYLTDSAVTAIVQGPRFTLLQSLDPAAYGNDLGALIDAELAIRLMTLNEASVELSEITRNWSSSIAAVLDTNTFCQYGPRLSRVDWWDIFKVGSATVVLTVPVQVVEELDRLKDRAGNGEQRNNARFALKWLDEQLGNAGPLETRLSGKQERPLVLRVWVDDNDRIPLPGVDRDIIDRALQLQPFVHEAAIVSRDRSMLFRARSVGLTATRLTDALVPARQTGPSTDNF